MKYSLVDNIKSEPFKGGKGNCILCGRETIAKCGIIKVHHWAHKSLKNCDPWWENETEWHRKWKNYFPNEWQEIIHFDEITGEKHIADVKTSNGLVIEFQNSPMSIEELKSREKFYKNMIWIINGKSFKKNFYILHELPNPKAVFVKDIAFMDRKKDHQGKLFFRYSENEENASMVLVHSVNDLKDEINSNYIGHHLYDWVRPRTVWLNSNCRVFIDFDDDEILELQTYDTKGLKCIRKYNKEHFIKRAIKK
jgi:competence protein CoiA